MTRTALIALIRKLPQYEAWKRSVFIRDRFQCQQCGARNGRKRVIEAHHITELSTLIKMAQIETVEAALDYSPLWIIANGKTLCHACHEQTDTYPENFKSKKTSMNRKTSISESERESIIALYSQGESSTKIASKFGVTASCIIGRLKIWGIKRRTRLETRKKHPIDETFLDSIDSEQKAYYLGFMYADGYNGERRLKYSVKISLQSRDRHILESFKQILKSGHTVSTENRRGGSSTIFEFCNKRLSERLTELGCHRAKSFTLTFPDWMPQDLLPHFIRGYIDGDGWIGFKSGKKEESYCLVGAIGSIRFIKLMGELIMDKCGVGVSYSNHPTSSEIIRLQVSGRNQVSTVLAWLYKDATIYLERKKRKAEEVLVPNIINKKPNGSDCHLSTLVEAQVLEIKSILSTDMTLVEIGKRFGVSKGAIGSIARGQTWHHLTNFTKRDNAARGQVKGDQHTAIELI